MASCIANTSMLLVQLPSVLSDVFCPVFVLKQQKKSALSKGIYLHYIFLPDSVSNLLLQHFSDQIS